MNRINYSVFFNADRGIYGLFGTIPYLLREMLAIVKALPQIHFIRPYPTFLVLH